MTMVPQTEAAPAIGDADRYREAIAAFSDVAAALSGNLDLDKLLHVVCDQLCGLVGIARASLYLKDPQSGAFKGQVARNDTDIDAYIKRYTAGTPADRLTREIVRRKEPVLVANAQSDPRPVRAQMRRWEIHTILGVPMVHNEEVIGLIYLDNGEEPYPYTAEQQELAQVFANLAASAVAQAAAERRLRASMATLSRQNELLKQVSVINDRLTALVLGGASVGEIANAIADLAGNPCVIHDASFARLAESDSRGERPDSVLDDRFRGHPSLVAEIRALSEKRAAVIAPGLAVGLRRRFLVAPVTVRGECWGYLSIEERNSPFGKLETMLAQRAAAIVALELVAARRGAEADFDSRRALVAELVRGGESPELTRRARRLGIDLTLPRLVAVARSRVAQAGNVPTAREFVDALRVGGELADVLAAEVGEDVVLVLEPGPEVAEGEAEALVAAALERARPQLSFERDLLVGISSVCHEPADYGRAHFEAVQIATLLGEHGAPRGDGEIFALSSAELGAGRLLLASHTPRQLDQFLLDALGALVEAGNPRNEVLLETLDCYFRECRSTGRAAVALGVHENSVRYRIGSVEELTGLDLSGDGDAIMRAQLALLAVRLRSRLAAPESAAPAA